MKTMVPFVIDEHFAAVSQSVVMSAGIDLLAANDPKFSEFVPDDFKAYFRFRICTALPKVIGPEMSGNYFGLHPQVLLNSYRSLLHQQTNIGHALKAYGATRDRIIGTVVGVEVRNLQRGTSSQKIPATVDEAPYLDVIAVVHKQAEGVKELLGRHVSAREKTSVSIEILAAMATMAVYDPRDRMVHPLEVAAETWPGLITVGKKDKSIRLGKVEGTQFAWVPGGENGTVPLRGVGYTPRPAEGATARVLDLAAEESGDTMALAAIAMNDWDRGVDVKWHRLLAGDVGRGRVVDVITAGAISRHGSTKVATPADPLLEISVAGKRLTVVRHASSVVKLGA